MVEPKHAQIAKPPQTLNNLLLDYLVSLGQNDEKKSNEKLLGVVAALKKQADPASFSAAMDKLNKSTEKGMDFAKLVFAIAGFESLDSVSLSVPLRLYTGQNLPPTVIKDSTAYQVTVVYFTGEQLQKKDAQEGTSHFIAATKAMVKDGRSRPTVALQEYLLGQGLGTVFMQAVSLANKEMTKAQGHSAMNEKETPGGHQMFRDLVVQRTVDENLKKAAEHENEVRERLDKDRFS